MDDNHFRELIHHRLNDVRTELDRIGSTTASVELDQTRVGRLSRMDAIQQQQMGLELQRRLNRELCGLEAALNRLEAGEYGQCVHCGEDIDPRRMELDLATTLCVPCASSGESQ